MMVAKTILEIVASCSIAWVALAYFFFKRRDWLGSDDWPTVALIVLFALAPAVTPLVWKTDAYYGIAYLVATSIPFVIMALSTEGLELPSRTPEIVLGLSLVAVISVVPVSIIPALRQEAEVLRSTSRSKAYKEIDLSFVKDTLGSMRKALADAESSVQAEREKIEVSIERLQGELESRNEQLRQLNRQHEKLEEQVRHYKKLAELTEEQAEAVRTQLERGKYVDYFFGFLIGLASSTIVTFISRIRTWAPKP